LRIVTADVTNAASHVLAYKSATDAHVTLAFQTAETVAISS
jgi:hypothetical protein